ncbi:MAG: helix-turn-helix domain-containing protein [Ectothiorhodospiraceae bacterium]|nr:helix-turn-helix domain-containing protein [Ectothiorhodospiraceae bacterium]
MPAADNPLSISLLALPETTPSALYGLFEVLGAVGVAWTELTGEETGVRRFEPRIVSRCREPFRSALGVPVAPDAALQEIATPDVIIVTDLALDTGLECLASWDAEVTWLKARFEAGAMICSVCTGSVLLAEAGLLDGMEATTHWGVTGVFAQRYPAVHLRPERILCPSGSEHRIVTAGGSSSWADLALYLVARFSGPAEAARIAKVFVLGDRADGQLPFAAMARPRDHGDAVIGRCQRWLGDHYDERNPVASMVAMSGLAERTFKRRFKRATAYAPIDYVQALRVEEAKQMLETSGAPTDEIAILVGYDDPAFFRRLFKRSTGVTPARYRKRYRHLGMAMPAEDLQ